MRVYTTAPLEDPRDARVLFPRLEAIGYDGAFSFEAKHDPFLPLAQAAEHTRQLRLGTAVAIAFARNPMNVANLAWGLQTLSAGRFVLGLGSQVRAHIEKRFGMALAADRGSPGYTIRDTVALQCPQGMARSIPFRRYRGIPVHQPFPVCSGYAGAGQTIIGS